MSVIQEGLSIHQLVQRSIGLSVGPSVCHAFLKNMGNQYIEQMSARGEKLGSLDASFHHYIVVNLSIGLSIRQSVCHTFVIIIENPRYLEKSHVTIMQQFHQQVDTSLALLALLLITKGPYSSAFKVTDK